MTSRKTKITALLLCLVMCFASFSPAASALSCDGETVTVMLGSICRKILSAECRHTPLH